MDERDNQLGAFSEHLRSALVSTTRVHLLGSHRGNAGMSAASPSNGPFRLHVLVPQP